MPELLILDEEIPEEKYFLKLCSSRITARYGGVRITLRLLSYELGREYIDLHLLGVSQRDIEVNDLTDKKEKLKNALKCVKTPQILIEA